MGISPDIKKLVLRATPRTTPGGRDGLGWAEQAWHPRGNEMRHAGTPPAQRSVYIEDYLIRFRGISSDELYTVRELFMRMWQPVEKILFGTDAMCLVYVLVCDDRELVPSYKADTQIARAQATRRSDESHAIEPAVSYPSPWNLDERGITYVENGHEITERRIDLRRLRVSDPKQKALWNAFIPFIRSRMAEQVAKLLDWCTVYDTSSTNTTPSSNIFTSLRRIDYVATAERIKKYAEPRSFIFDYKASGAQWFTVMQDCMDVVSMSSREPLHYLGEADPAMIWWLHELTYRWNTPTLIDCIVYLVTTDTDIIPLYALYVTQLQQLHLLPIPPPSPPQVRWCTTNDTYVDMVLLAECISKHMRLDAFVFFCMVAGNCDYVPAAVKATYSARVGVLATLAAVRDSGRHAVYTEGGIDHAVRSFVRLLPTSPSMSAINDLSSRVNFNMSYWVKALTGIRDDLSTSVKQHVQNNHAIEREESLFKLDQVIEQRERCTKMRICHNEPLSLPEELHRLRAT